MMPAEAHVAGALALARAILSGRDNEITCAECRSWLPTCVQDARGLDPAWRPRIEQHLACCPSCAAAYDALHEAVELAESRLLVEPPAYPQFQVPRSRCL